MPVRRTIETIRLVKIGNRDSLPLKSMQKNRCLKGTLNLSNDQLFYKDFNGKKSQAELVCEFQQKLVLLEKIRCC